MSDFKAQGPIGRLIHSYRADPFRFFCGLLLAFVAIGFFMVALVVCLIIRCTNEG